MNAERAREIVAHKTIYCDEPDPLQHHQEYSIAVGYLECYAKAMKMEDVMTFAIENLSDNTGSEGLYNPKSEFREALAQWKEEG